MRTFLDHGRTPQRNVIQGDTLSSQTGFGQCHKKEAGGAVEAGL
ncbi:MAG TPA: hypothetical protein VGM27_19590 [Acidobacteriaceae bacterium]